MSDDTAILALTPNFTPTPQRVVISVWRDGRWLEVDPLTYIQPQNPGCVAADLALTYELDERGHACRLRFTKAMGGEGDGGKWMQGMQRMLRTLAPLDPQEIVWPCANYPVDADGRGVSWMEWEQRRKAMEKAA